MFNPFHFKTKGLFPRHLICDGEKLMEKGFLSRKSITLKQVISYSVEHALIIFKLPGQAFLIDLNAYPKELQDWIARYFLYRPDEHAEYELEAMTIVQSILGRLPDHGDQILVWTAKGTKDDFIHEVTIGGQSLQT